MYLQYATFAPFKLETMINAINTNTHTSSSSLCVQILETARSGIMSLRHREYMKETLWEVALVPSMFPAIAKKLALHL